MLSIGAVRSSMAAASYFAKDNYYARHDEGPSQWFGAAALRLGLQGEVGAERFKQLLEGHIDPDTQLGRIVAGERQHRHGWDLTFSAAKSISLAALVGGDERLIQAHDAAVRETLAWLQDKALTTRTGEQGRMVDRATGTMLATVFRHDLSRAAEPQLHSHAVVMNATSSSEVHWTSVNPIHLYTHAKEAGERYQQALALRAVELGYTIVPSRNGTFELDGIPRDLALSFSSRAKAVEGRLAEQGLTRATATGEQREDAALRTRPNKTEIDRTRQRQLDRQKAREAGVDLERLVAGARGRAQEHDHAIDARNQGGDREHSSGDAQGRGQRTADDRSFADGRSQAAATPIGRTTETALNAVREAAEILSERDAAFTGRELEQRARILSLGEASARDIDQAVRELAERGELAERMVLAVDPVTRKHALQPGWTTRELIATERAMLRHEQAGRGTVGRMMSRLDAELLVREARALATEHGFSWTGGQTEATIGVLATGSRVIGIQGYAGTAKTTTVLATVAEAARRDGYFVKGLAPTIDATQNLARAIRSEAVTVQKQVADLAMGRVITSARQPKELWIVDEASLVGARAMATLLAGAARQDARVLLVGDEKQLGSVEAGRAFAQLQEAGMPTFRLTEIVRQTNEHTKQAVYASLQADAARALAAIERGGGEVIEIKGDNHAAGAHHRRALLAERYAALSPDERRRTVLADPSRSGRKELNEQVRESLKARGELQGPTLVADILVPKGLTTGEQRKTVAYEHGDIVRFRSDLRPRHQDALRKDVSYTIVGRDVRQGVLQLQDERRRFVTWRPEQYGARHAEVYRREQRELAVGDRIGWTKAMPAIGAANGQTAEVTTIDARRGTITIAMGSRSATLPAAGMQHLDHAYAQTAHRLQGQTADRALLHLEDWRLNLTNQRSFYVLLSRAKDGVTIATSNREGLIAAIHERTGEQQAALDALETRLAPTIARAAMEQHSREPEPSEAAHRNGGARRIEQDMPSDRGSEQRDRDRDDDLSY